MSNHNQEKPVASSESCLYGSVGHDGSYYVLCMSCRDFHGLADSRTKKSLALPTRCQAERLSAVLNAQAGR